jgi:hypothetical protein
MTTVAHVHKGVLGVFTCDPLDLLSMIIKSVPFSVIEKCTTPKGVWG